MNPLTESNLSKLMKAFGVTGRELAKAVHVDYSLVSKWKNGKRALQPRSSYVSLLSDYFLSIDSNTGNRKITALLYTAYPDTNIASADLSALLCHWLTEEDGTSASSLESSFAMLEIDSLKSMYCSSFEVYQGKKGRRAAVLKFLDFILSLPAGQNLLLISQEDMSWLTEDKDFLLKWKRKLIEIILKKHRTTIIHTVDRSADELAPILQQWLPLHMSGCIESYYLPQYADARTKNTLFIIQGIAAVFGVAAVGIPDDLYTALYRDSVTVAACESLYKNLIASCVPLLEKYPVHSPHQLFVKMLNSIMTGEDSYFHSNLPMLPTISGNLLKEILEANNVEPKKIDYCRDMIGNAAGLFHSTGGKYCTRHIYNYEVLKQASSMKRIAYSDLSMLAGCSIYLTPEQYRKHVFHLISLIECNDDFEVGLLTGSISELENNVNTWVQKNNMVLSTSSALSSHSLYAVSALEPTVVNAFYHYYTNIWNSIPRIYRNKEWVIEALTRIVQ